MSDPTIEDVARWLQSQHERGVISPASLQIYLIALRHVSACLPGASLENVRDDPNGVRRRHA